MLKLAKTPDNLKGNVTAADAAGLWKDAEVKNDKFDEKFEIVPEKFEVFGVMGATIKFKTENDTEVVRESVPAFMINPEGSKYILLSTIRASYFSDSSKSDFVPTQITKEGDNSGKYMVVNNRQVNTFTEGKSVNEITAYMLNKRYFKSEPAKTYYKYTPEFVDQKPQFANKKLQGDGLKDELLKRVFAKRYVKILPEE